MASAWMSFRPYTTKQAQRVLKCFRISVILVCTLSIGFKLKQSRVIISTLLRNNQILIKGVM